MIASLLSDLQLISIIVTTLISLISSSVILFHVIYYWIGRLKTCGKWVVLGELNSYPLVSIVVPVRNEPLDIIVRLLNSIVNQDYPRDKIEVLIVSDDDEDYFRVISSKILDFSRRSGLMIKVFRRERAIGFKAGALNYALYRSMGKYLVVFDVDAVPEPNYLRCVVSYLEANCDVDGLAVKWSSLNRDSTPISEAQAVSLNFLTSIFFDGRSRVNGPIIAPGCGCVFRRSVLLEVGGWDEDCLAEDVELSIRLLVSNRKIDYLDSTFVGIENPETYEAFKKQQARWIYGTTQVLSKYFFKIITSNIPFFWKLDLILYLLQYHVLLVNFVFIVLALASILARVDLLLPSIYFSPFLVALSILQAFSYYSTARRLDFNSIESVVIMGRCTAMATVLAPIVLLQNFKLLVGWREGWYITPKGSLAKRVRGGSLLESLLATSSILIAIVLLIFGFPISASCIFTFSIPYAYVSWKTSRGVW